MKFYDIWLSFLIDQMFLKENFLFYPSELENI